MVMFDRVLDDIDCDKVLIDDYYAAKQATKTLIERGKKQIAFISAIDDLHIGKLRKKGYNSTVMSDYLSEMNPLVLVIKPEDDIQSQIMAFLLNNRTLDGVVCADNVTGTVLISVANKLGYTIPEDLSVIGFADEQISNLSSPKLSYIDQNAERIGSKAAALMIHRLNGSSELAVRGYITEKIPTSIVIKES